MVIEKEREIKRISDLMTWQHEMQIRKKWDKTFFFKSLITSDVKRYMTTGSKSLLIKLFIFYMNQGINTTDMGSYTVYWREHCV